MGEEAIQRLLGELESLRDGDQAVGKLMACGPSAVAPLRKLLMEGRPSGIYQPRRWAVQALAGLRAKHVLVEYLLAEKEIPDPVARFGEEAVKNAAARLLAEWRSEEIFQVLLSVAQRHLLPGVVEALGEFARPEAIPYLDRALEDDLCRVAAEEAFRRVGEPAQTALLLSAGTPLPDRLEESPSSLLRRRRALKLLGEIGARPEDWGTLRPLLEEPDPELIVRAAALGVRVAPKQDRPALAGRLLQVLPAAGWYLHDDIEHTLVELFDEAEPEIDAAIQRRMALPARDQVLDTTLPVLLHVKRRRRQARKCDRRSA